MFDWLLGLFINVSICSVDVFAFYCCYSLVFLFVEFLCIRLGPFMFTVGACCRSLAKVDNLMDLVPCQRLESHCAEPCAVCYEDMVLGDLADLMLV